MAKLLARHTDRRFQKSYQQCVFADELTIKILQLRGCFLGNSLPLPTAEVIAAWKDLPNVTTGKLPMSMKTRVVFLRAPPPTPTGLAFDADGAVPSDLSSDASHDHDGDWLFVDDATSSMSDEMVPRAFGGSTASEDDPTLRCNYLDQSLDQQINEEGSPRSTDSNSLSSDHESHSSSGEVSSTPVGFHNMVNQWLLDYRARGTDTFIESLIAFGVVSMGTARLASRIARSIVRKVAKVSCTEGKSLEKTIRLSALAAFKNCWESNDTWTEASSTQANAVPPIPYGINIASLLGGLFREKISTATDIHLCLFLLLEGEKRFHQLCAMHALLVQANDKLCKNRNLPALVQFRDRITSISEESGEYLWATTPRSKMILTDILATIERWFVSQALKREQSRISSWSGSRTIRNSAVGPRLRNSQMAFGL